MGTGSYIVYYCLPLCLAGVEAGSGESNFGKEIELQNSEKWIRKDGDESASRQFAGLLLSRKSECPRIMAGIKKSEVKCQKVTKPPGTTPM